MLCHNSIRDNIRQQYKGQRYTMSLVIKKSKFTSILAKACTWTLHDNFFLNQFKCIILGVKICKQSKFSKVTKINQIHLKEITCFQVTKAHVAAVETLSLSPTTYQGGNGKLWQNINTDIKHCNAGI